MTENTTDALQIAYLAETADLAGYPTAKKANEHYLCLLEDCAQMIRRLHAENETLRMDLDLLAQCRSAFPIPERGDPLEVHWAAAMADPGEVPKYLQEIAARHAAQAAPVAVAAAGGDSFLLLPTRPAPDAPANTSGLSWDAYSGAQMLAYGRACSDAALVVAAPQLSPAAQGDAMSDDAVRVPLDSLHADAAYLIGRLREGSMPYARVIEIIRERVDAAKAAIRARAAQEGK